MILGFDRLYAGLPVLCAAAAAIGVAGVWGRRRRAIRAGRLLAVASLAAVAVAWIWRWWEAEHLPLFGTYESSLSLAVVVLTCGVALELYSRAEGVVPGTCLVAAVLLAQGVRFDPGVYALTISERSWVVDVHAVVAWAAFGVLTANAALAVTTLRNSGREGPWLGRTLSWGFVLHSAMLATGSLYEFLLFGRLWSFDPIETLGLVAWLAYGTLLHLHLMAGWRDRRLAGWCLLVFVLLVVSYRAIIAFPPWSTYHIFDMDRRIHVVGS